MDQPDTVNKKKIQKIFYNHTKTEISKTFYISWTDLEHLTKILNFFIFTVKQESLKLFYIYQK